MTNKLILEINRPTSAADDQKTAAFPRRRSRKGGRRRIGGRMNFWDLSMVSTGPAYDQWTMLPFQPSACPWGTSSGTFDTTWHQELLDEIFTVPVEEWATHYKRIVPEMDYPLEIRSRDVSGFYLSTQYYLNSSNPAFTNAGLKVEADFFDDGKMLGTNLVVSDGSALFNTQFLQKGASSATSGCYVTSVYDPSAAEVDFEPRKDCDVFLVPALPYALCRFEYHAPPSGSPVHTQQLNEFFYLLDRGVYLTPGHSMYGQTLFVNFTNSASVPSEGSQAEYDALLALADYFKGMDNARGRYATAFLGPYGSEDDGSAFGSVLPGSYSYTPPPPDTLGTRVMAASIDGNTSNTATSRGNDNQTLLRAVIRQGGQYYYVWNWENVP